MNFNFRCYPYIHKRNTLSNLSNLLRSSVCTCIPLEIEIFTISNYFRNVLCTSHCLLCFGECNFQTLDMPVRVFDIKIGYK